MGGMPCKAYKWSQPLRSIGPRMPGKGHVRGRTCSPEMTASVSSTNRLQLASSVCRSIPVLISASS